LKLLPIVEAEHQSVFARKMEPALWQASGVPKVVRGPAGGSRGVGEWAGLAQLRRYPMAVADAVGRFLAGWVS
jgi:acetylornithine deacetylase